MIQKEKKFYVYIEENAHYMDESCRCIYAVYDNYAEAYRECRTITESSVSEFFDYDFTEEENYNLYSIYGVSPWFDPEGEGEPFSASVYAREYIKNLFAWKCYLD